MPMKIQIENRQNKIKIDRRKMRGTVTKILKLLDCANSEVSISLVDDADIRVLNKQYLGRDRATNVISFSLLEGECGDVNPQTLGDIVISVETARRDAAAGRLTTEQEIDFLLIHGILHLLGYNHENTTKQEAARMKKKEKELFNTIHFANTLSI